MESLITYIGEVTPLTKDTESYLNPEVFDKLLEFKLAHNVDKIEMYQTLGTVFNFYISPSVAIEYVNQLSDEIDDLATSTYDDTTYCAFAYNKTDKK